MKRAVLATLLLLIGALLVYGYTVTRQERLYRQLLADGDGALARGDSFAAVDAFGRAIGLRPQSMVAYLKRGEAHRRRGDLEAAAVDLGKASALDPGSARALELLGDIEAARDAYVSAADHYQASARLDDRPRVLYKLALAHNLAGNTAAAVEPLSSAIAADGRFAEAHYLLGACLRELNRPGEAEAALRRALALAPRLAAAREQLAVLYQSTGRRTAAITELERLLADDGHSARHIQVARAYAANGQMPRAVRMLRAAAARYPDDPGIPRALGLLWLDVGDATADPAAMRNAIEALESAVAIEPTGDALAGLARARLAAGEFAAAAAALQEASDRLPVDPAAYLDFAEEAERLKQPDLARDALVISHALTTDEGRRHLLAMRIADDAARLGRADEALRWSAMAAASPRATPGTLVKLAERQLGAGDRAAARASVARALELDPQHAAALSLQRRLQ